MLKWGGMAEQVVAEATHCIRIPRAMPYEDGAAFIMGFGTSYHALKQRGLLKPGETLLVLGASGGVGLAAVELGNAMGARVVAAVRMTCTVSAFSGSCSAISRSRRPAALERPIL